MQLLQSSMPEVRTDYRQSGLQEMDRNIEKKEVSSKSAITEAIVKKESNSMDFAGLCKKFPDISFVVVDCFKGPVSDYSEYAGICDTSNFGDFSKVSIEINIEVLENLEKDYDNIVRKIQEISDEYKAILAGAVGYKYTVVTLSYSDTGTGELGYTQSLLPEEPIVCRRAGIQSATGKKSLSETSFEAYLRNVQQETFDKLLEVGAVEKEQKVPSAKEGAETYQEHFIYE